MSNLAIPTSVQHQLQHRGSSSKYAVDSSASASGSDNGSSASSKSSTNQKSEPKSTTSLSTPPTTQHLQRKRSSLPTLEPPALQSDAASTNHQGSSGNTSSNRRRSTPTAIKHDKSKPQTKKKLTKNYSHMVQDYNAMKKYAKQDDGSYLAKTRCVFCEIERPRLVFFPCQHKCVCDHCLSLNDITSDPTSPAAWTACPVCMTDIRLMLPHTGNEEELYWRWALQAPQVLPLHFKSDFKFAGRKLRGSSSSVQPNTGEAESMETPPATATTTTTSKPPAATQPAPFRKSRSVATSFSQHSLRRFSLAMRRSSTAGGTPTVAETLPEQQSKCCIL